MSLILTDSVDDAHGTAARARKGSWISFEGRKRPFCEFSPFESEITEYRGLGRLKPQKTVESAMSKQASKTRFILPGDARVAMSFVVNVEEGSEMSVLEGDKKPEPMDELGVALRVPIRNHGNESNYQYGIRAGAPRVQKLLLEHGVRATWAAAAQALERAPQLARWIAEQRHEACAHGYRWIHHFSFDEDEERQYIRRTVASLKKSTGERPLGWLSRYLHTDRTRRLLAEEGFLYHMDDYGDDVPRWEVVPTADGAARPIVVLPYALDTNDMKFWLAPGYTPAMWLDYIVATFDQLYEEGAEQPKMMSLGLHLRVIGRPGRIGALARFMAYVASKRAVWIATRREIAERFVTLNPFFEPLPDKGPSPDKGHAPDKGRAADKGRATRKKKKKKGTSRSG